ncbi:cryptochrome/photolyase family protein [Tenacibaculum sp. nBUS_03]|uniref:cryptochrome/photolyase family protein n=1 Tax=Tenacibaculum sp. nBUS_03 TaxID=3395320 RepID=UPI003EB81AA6
MQSKISIYWFRRDLRLDDNTALHYALKGKDLVLPIFIFDDDILDKLPKDDARITFIYNSLKEIQLKLNSLGSSIEIKKGNPFLIWKELLKKYTIENVFFNKDYEPYALERDKKIIQLLEENNIKVNTYKDQVIFEESEVLKKDNTPYTVYTPYKNQWLKIFSKENHTRHYNCSEYSQNYLPSKNVFPTIQSLGFTTSTIQVKPYSLNNLDNYEDVRDFPSINGTSNLSPYLRFGQVSVRKMVIHALKTNSTFLSELIWREFFMQILYHFPKVVTQNFKSKYDRVPWRNNQEEFEKWCKGETGYPIVDAGMRELNTTGYMHNRVRMITAGFLCKHLLIDWRWGEAYFASKLLDYELASNNGNWQWSAGTGCDAAPYFRVFNPESQLKKFDKNLIYINKWIIDFNELTYPNAIVEHKFARERAITTYKNAL